MIDTRFLCHEVSELASEVGEWLVQERRQVEGVEAESSSTLISQVPWLILTLFGLPTQGGKIRAVLVFSLSFMRYIQIEICTSTFIAAFSTAA